MQAGTFRPGLLRQSREYAAETAAVALPARSRSPDSSARVVLLRLRACERVQQLRESTQSERLRIARCASPSGCKALPTSLVLALSGLSGQRVRTWEAATRHESRAGELSPLRRHP